MRKIIIALLIVMSGTLLACKKSNEEFVGKWSNEYMGNGAALRMEITKDGDGLLVKEIITTNGNVLGTYLASIDGNHLNMPTNPIFKTLVLSDDKRSLAVVNTFTSYPDFHKVQ